MLRWVEVANIIHEGKVGEEGRIFHSVKCNRQNRRSLRPKIGSKAQGKGRNRSCVSCTVWTEVVVGFPLSKPCYLLIFSEELHRQNTTTSEGKRERLSLFLKVWEFFSSLPPLGWGHQINTKASLSSIVYYSHHSLSHHPCRFLKPSPCFKGKMSIFLFLFSLSLNLNL